MPEYLAQLLEATKGLKMTPQDHEGQRRSFAYGNAKIENDRITRDSIDKAAEALARESTASSRK